MFFQKGKGIGGLTIIIAKLKLRLVMMEMKQARVPIEGAGGINCHCTNPFSCVWMGKYADGGYMIIPYLPINMNPQFKIIWAKARKIVLIYCHGRQLADVDGKEFIMFFGFSQIYIFGFSFWCY